MMYWRDGMGRVTIKTETGQASRGQVVLAGALGLGLCRAPGWVQISGPTQMQISTSPVTPAMRQYAREQMAARARRHRLPSAARYNPAKDPRLFTRW